jgi:hypothetical protein
LGAGKVRFCVFVLKTNRLWIHSIQKCHDGKAVSHRNCARRVQNVVPGHGDLDILLVILYRRVKVPSVRSILYSTT